MNRAFKHQGFEEIRGADACVINKKAVLALPRFSSEGKITIEGECVKYSENEPSWPDMVFKLNSKVIGRISLGEGGPFKGTFDIGHARGERGLRLRIHFDYDRMPALLSVVARANPKYRRKRRNMLRAMGRNVLVHSITLDGRTLADFTHGAATFLREFSLEELGMGMNIVGFFQHEFGIGESARCCASAAKAAGVPTALNLAKMGTHSAEASSQWSDAYRDDNPYPVNLFHVDSPQIKFVRSCLGAGFMANRYNIGYWAWELPEFPDYALSNMDYVDEIWVPSGFVRQSMVEKSTVPILVMPHAVEFDVPTDVTRAKLGLPADDFLFLLMYDINSSQKRKNPQAAIRAFQSVFPDPKGVKLVVKTHGAESNPEDFLELQNLVANSPGIVLINRTLTRGELHALQNLCDCFVSLHRSEGFGLGLAECMYLAKPVIATNWSGNLQYMDSASACMVNYEMVELKESCGPYKKGQMWAEPDVDHAAWWMKKIVADPAFRNEIALKGRERIVNDFSRLKIGKLYERRLHVLSNWI